MDQQEAPMSLAMLGGSDQKFQEKETQPGGDNGYRGAEARCYNCEYFQDPDRCKKGVNGGKVDPEGSCNLFEMAGDEAEGQTEEQEPGEGMGR